MLSTTWGGGLALADGVIRDGLGAVSLGRGGTNIAHSDNGEILLDNPAALVNMRGTRLAEVSLDVLFTDLSYSDPQNGGVDAEPKPFPLAELSLLAKSEDGQWAAGLGAFAPAGFGAEWDLVGPPLLPGTHRYKSLGCLGKIIPGVAVRLTDRLSAGATLGVGLSHAELEGPCFLQSGPVVIPASLDVQATGAALVWSVGLQYELSERTTWGMSYTSESRFHLDGNARVDVFPLQGEYDARVDLTWPRSVGLGVKHSLCDHQRVSADVIWFNWSDSFDDIGLRLSNGSNLFLPPGVADQFPLNWRDSVSVRLGYERTLSPRCVLRTGYVYHSTNIPDSTLTTYIPAILEHAFSVGLGSCWRGCNVDVAYQFSFGPERTVSASSIVGGDFDSSRFTGQAHWLLLSLSQKF